jgi:hypothetical protein
MIEVLDASGNVECQTQVRTSSVRRKWERRVSDASGNVECQTQVGTSSVRRKWERRVSDASVDAS